MQKVLPQTPEPPARIRSIFTDFKCSWLLLVFAAAISSGCGSAATEEPAPQAVKLRTCQLHVTPPDAVVSINRATLAPATDGQYRFETSSSAPIEIQVSKTGWQSYQQTVPLESSGGAAADSLFVISLTPDPQWWLNAASTSYKQHDFLAAWGQLEIVNLIEPDNIKALDLKIFTALEMGEPDTARELIDSIRQFPKHSDRDFTDEERRIDRQTGEAAMATGNLDLAIELLTRADKAGAPDNESVRSDLVRALLARTQAANRAGNVAVAQKDTHAILGLSPENTLARLELGFSLAKSLQFDEAIAQFNRVLENAPLTTNALLYRGYCRWQTRQYELAIEDLSAAIGLRPNSGHAFLIRGSVMLETNQLGQAITDLQQALKLTNHPTPQTHFLLALAHDRTGEIENALKHYDVTLQLNPNHETARLNRSILLNHLGQPEIAVEDTAVVLAGAARHPNALNSHGATSALLDQPDTAIESFTAAIENSPDYVAAWFNRGLVRLKLRQYDLAISDFSAAIERDPSTADFYLGRAKAAMQIGEFQNARADLKTILDSSPNDAEATQLLKLLGAEEKTNP